MSNVIELVKQSLASNGFDGLYVSGTCGCEIYELSPGECLCESCEGGYKKTHSGSGEWVIASIKDKMSDDEISDILSSC